MSVTTQYQPYYPDGIYRIDFEDYALRVHVESDHVRRVYATHLPDPVPITARDGALGIEIGHLWIPMRWVWRLIGASFGSNT